MKRFCGLLFMIVMGMVITGCSTKPSYYSEKEVKDYVQCIFGKGYELSDTLTYKDEEGENDVHEYVFSQKEEASFSVYASTYHPSIDGSATQFYERAIHNNYLEKCIEFKQDEINEIMENYPDSWEIMGSSIQINIEDYTQLEDVANRIMELDELMSFEYEYTNWKDTARTDSLEIGIYLKPNNEHYENQEEEWETRSYAKLDSIYLSHNKAERLTAAGTFAEMERGLVYKIRREEDASRCPYTLPDEILYKYPAEYLTFCADDVEYHFTYDATSDSYWIRTLDPCQGFEGHYNYQNMYQFKGLVELCQGTYNCDQWNANWSIGDDTWKAELMVDEDKNFQDFILYKNGDKALISEYNGMTNGTVSGRGFTLEDVEKMLGIEFVIDQKNAVLELNTDKN